MNLEKYDKALGTARDAGLLVMRVGVGLCFLYIHGFPKITAGVELWVKLGGAMGNLGIHFAPGFWGFMAASAEFFGGACLVLGLLTRPAAAVMAFNMLVASVLHLSQGDGLQTASHALENMFLFAGLILTGGGRYSLDRQLFKGSF